MDRDIFKSSALVVDPNPTSRSLLASQLRDLGVGTVVQCHRIHEARRLLESRTFDAVLCEQDFEAEGYSAQGLLDDLRRLQLLPLATVLIIVTGAASYTTVAEAAESAVDSYLVKPYTAAALGERLMQSRRRKKAMAEIFAAVDGGDLKRAAHACIQRTLAQGPSHAQAARLGCELLLRLGEAEAARQLGERVLARDPAVPWARLTIARAQIEGGKAAAAVRTIETLVADQPQYTDALDVLGRLMLEQGDLPAAVAAYAKAADVTPGSIVRLQRHGISAFYAGLRQEAARPIDRAALLGAGSRMFDPQVLVLQAALRMEQRDGRGLTRSLGALQDLLDKEPEQPRWQRLARVAQVLSLAHHKLTAEVAAELSRWSLQLLDPALDLETACNLLTVWATLTQAGCALPEADGWIDTVALRFASSRGATELMAGAASAWLPHAARVRQGQQAVAALSEAALGHAVDQHPEEAVLLLLEAGERILNAKLTDLATRTLQRHQQRVPEAAALAARLIALRDRTLPGAGMPPLGQVGRSVGGLAVRTVATPTTG